ncbi:HdeD family acid-resistance protein [Phycicoccus avicenniae]|uniref:HdeD family acid-resistance protein n=1 Tax=Phycicoccus avicenniae TaxID=2828860 RepID=UPI003D2A10E9
MRVVQWQVLVVQGVVAALFGVLAMARPVTTGLSLVVLWGLFALVDGVAALVGVFSAEGGLRRTLLLAMGVVSVLAGLVAVLNPVYAAVTLTWVLGLWLLVRAGLEAYAATALSTGSTRWLRLLGAVFLVVAGVLFVARPGAAALGIALWLGVFALLAGITLVVAGLALRSAPATSQGPLGTPAAPPPPPATPA